VYHRKGMMVWTTMQCTTKDTENAISKLKDACFKVDIHIMPNLPGTTPEMDKQMFDDILYNEYLQADQWKIYPCAITPWTIIKKWFDNGSYKPYSEEDLIKVLLNAKTKIHPWIRINRIVRDIPSQYILNGDDQ
jgi:histone acetyltransferase (RNA polymerase elongator complex component)